MKRTCKEMLLAVCFCLVGFWAQADIQWTGEDGYWSDPTGWNLGRVPNGASGEGNVLLYSDKVLCITNGDDAASYGFAVRGGGVVKLLGGSWTNYRTDDVFYICHTAGHSGTVEVHGGALWLGGNMMVPNKGNGTFRQYGGSTSVNRWMTLATSDDAAGEGHVLLLGGVFEQRDTGGSAGLIVGNQGCGDLVVGGTANVTVNGGWGLRFGNSPLATPTNTAILASGGSLALKKISTGSSDVGERRFVFDGGSLRVMNAQSSLVDGLTLTEFSVTERGGAIDTQGHDVTIAQPLSASSLDSSANLVHRWSFNGDLKDSVGGGTAALDGTASLETESGFVTLPGGAKGTAAVNLGTGVLPTSDTGFTVELWGRIDQTNSWATLFSSGSGDVDEFETYWFSNKANDWHPYLSIHYNDYTDRPYVFRHKDTSGWCDLAKEYHIAITVVPTESGEWRVTQYRYNAATGELEGTTVGRVLAQYGWSPSKLNVEEFWLGRSQYNNNDAKCAYDEVRIWDRPLSEKEILLNNLAGPDKIAGMFAKTGAGTLTLTGENAFTAPVRVEAGTLALAANATLAEECDVAIATNAVLSLASSAYPKGGVAIEVNEHGQTGCISSTSTLDLSKLSITIANPSALSKDHRYTIVTSTGGFTGTFASIDIPESWSLSTSVNSITIKPKGLTIIFK